jgi:hypothetical protein
MTLGKQALRISYASGVLLRRVGVLTHHLRRAVYFARKNRWANTPTLQEFRWHSPGAPGLCHMPLPHLSQSNGEKDQAADEDACAR